MFVRWKRRERRRDKHLCPFVRYAVLVKSERVDGKPRQRIVRYLAHIGESYLDATAHQQYFWDRVNPQLDDLDVDSTTRQSLEAALLAVVGRPTQAQLDQLDLDRRRLNSW
jgi:hypothetical protein